jgi:hypothetical protein
LVLIIDHDLGFVMWLGEMFNALGCQAVPALHCRNGLALAKKLKLRITTLVINPELPSAARTVKVLSEANPGVQVVLIRSSLDEQSSGIPARSTLRRPTPWEPISRADWLARVRSVLA